MGIDFDDQNVDVSGVSDQRGRSGGMGGPIAIGGGGLGIVGVILFVLVQVLGGGSGGGLDTSQLVPPNGQVQGQGAGESDLAQRCNTDGAIKAYDDCCLSRSTTRSTTVWTDEFGRRGRELPDSPA